MLLIVANMLYVEIIKLLIGINITLTIVIADLIGNLSIELIIQIAGRAGNDKCFVDGNNK